MRGPISFVVARIAQPEITGIPVEESIENIKGNRKLIALGSGALSGMAILSLLKGGVPPLEIDLNPQHLASMVPKAVVAAVCGWASAEAHSWRSEDEDGPEPEVPSA